MNNSYSILKDFMKKFPMTIAWRLKQHCKVVDKHLNSDEKILYMFAGQKNDSSIDIFHTYVVAFTNKRIMLCTKRVVFGYFLKSITPDMYNDLTVYRGLLFGRVILDTVKEVITITNIDVNALNDIETNITDVVLNYKKNLDTISDNKKSAKK